MNQPQKTVRVWYTLPMSKIIGQIDIPNMQEAFLGDLSKNNQQVVTAAILAIAREEIRERNADVAVLAVMISSYKTEGQMEFLLLLGGAEQQIEKVAGYNKPFDWHENALDHEAPTQYELIRASAFNLLRKQEVKDFSEDELWQAVKHSPHSNLYLAIIRREIDDGLTIKKLYAKRKDHGLER